MLDIERDEIPMLSPPFGTIDFGEFGKCICDVYGRTIIVENGNVGFVEELCEIMNENKVRLVDAWKRGLLWQTTARTT